MRRNVLTSLAGLVIVLLALAAAAKAQSYGPGDYSNDYLKARQGTEAMTDELRERVRQLPPNDYAVAKRFLRSLAYEAQQPINPSPAIAVTFP